MVSGVFKGRDGLERVGFFVGELDSLASGWGLVLGR